MNTPETLGDLNADSRITESQPTSTHKARDLVFLDTETLGLDLWSPIWEFSGTRRDAVTNEETDLYLQITHDPSSWLDTLDEPFATDYRNRFKPDHAVARLDAAHAIHHFTEGAIVVGVNPRFDTERISHQLLRPALLPPEPWYHHLRDVAALALGYLAARRELPEGCWSSNALSAALGVDPEDYQRHTAMDDVRWTRDQHDIIMGLTRESAA